MDGMMLVRGGRSSSASSTERSLLLGALANHMGVLDARENDAQTIVRKSELWDEITRQFNASTSAPRSRQQIQTLYKNMKAKARRYEARLAEVSSGVPPPDPDPISEMLLGLLHQQMQHQRRHLQRLISVDTHGMVASGDDALNASQHCDSNIVSPEQVMQVSLREGLTSEMDIKNEPRDDLCSPEVPPDEGTCMSPTESVPESSDSLSTAFTSKPVTVSRPLQLLTTEHSKTLSHTMVPIHRQQSIPTDDFQSTSVTTHQMSASIGQLPKMNAAYVSSHNTSPSVVHTHPLLALSEGSMTPDAYPAVKKPRLECGADILRYGGRLLPRPSTLCCCPDLHSQLLTLAHEEHCQRMKILKDDFEMRTREHAARMRILSLEEEKVTGKQKTNTTTSDNDETTPSHDEQLISQESPTLLSH